jgi:hypothetical protein
MVMIGLHNVYLTIPSITIILVTSIVLITLPEFPNSGIAQGQGNNFASQSLTPEQKAAMCNPNDKFVNDTESSVCANIYIKCLECSSNDEEHNIECKHSFFHSISNVRTS